MGEQGEMLKGRNGFEHFFVEAISNTSAENRRSGTTNAENGCFRLQPKFQLHRDETKSPPASPPA